MSDYEDDYFHTEQEHPLDGVQSPESPLVLASRGEDVASEADEDAPADAGELSDLTNAQLRDLIVERGIEFDGNLSRAGKPKLLEALGA